MAQSEYKSLYSKLLKSNISCDEIFLAPDIPEKLLNNALRVHGQCVEKSKIIALIEDTLFGSA